MINEKEFIELGFDNIVSYSGKDITPELVDRCFKLDKAFYKEDFLWENTDIKNTILKYNQMCFVFIDKTRGNIIGYSYWFPIKAEILEKFKNERTALLDIKVEYISGFTTPPVHLFLGGEAFVPGYDLMNLHKAVENIFQYHILYLAQKKNIKIETINFDAVCQYDKEFLVPRTGLKNYSEKSNCLFYYGKYDPKTVYNESKYCEELKKDYQ